MSSNNLPPSSSDHYPVEVAFPDISGYALGNTGIPYVFTFDSGVPGPHVMINSITHGNEVCGAITVAALLDQNLRPRRGRLTLSFANISAYESFDPDHPDASRCVDQDFNRVWNRSLLDDTTQDSVELRRARAMRPVLNTVDLLLDLHSMHERCVPLLMSGALDKRIEFARKLGTPATLISDVGHPEGRRMIDYEGFDDSSSPKCAVVVECGHHWEPSSIVVAKDAAARFLILTGAADAGDLPQDWFVPLPESQRVIRVTDPVVVTSMDFHFVAPYTGLELFPQAGTVIAWQDGKPVATPYSNCVLVMPSVRQLRPGATVARLGRLLNND
jgi:predicted deacylase